MKAEIGVVGLAVMGANLALNFESRGYVTAVYNRSAERTSHFMKTRGTGKKLLPSATPSEFCAELKIPRTVILMVKAGKPVDDTVAELLPFLQSGDVLIDGGNSFYEDTVRRASELAGRGIHFLGMGVSGGEEGALHGPSLMPGGDFSVWNRIAPMFRNIAAKAGNQEPCCVFSRGAGSGHFTKMVHNGIEYADMQMIADAYQILRRGFGLTPPELSSVFQEWNSSFLKSYLMEITASIFTRKDDLSDSYLVDKILDAAGQKGTGKWTALSAMDLGVPAETLAESVFMRALSSEKEGRIKASERLSGPVPSPRPVDRETLAEIAQALYASKICAYAQGFSLLHAAAAKFEWKFDYGNIAEAWRGGCIIRAEFLNSIAEAFRAEPLLENMLFAPFFRDALANAQSAWRKTVAFAVANGIPVPAFSNALQYYDSIRSAELPANLIQAQRDFFGAHTYERIDKPRGTFFHTSWSSDNQ